MHNTMTFKGYHGSVEISPDDDILFGQVLFISPLINYEAETAKGLEKAFQDAVNDYLTDCAQQDVTPEKPCKGSLNIRLGHDLHLAASVAAFQASMSTNDFIKRAVQKSVGS
nr:type II toxin-antitoxin system HicB family antitoxin [Shewanella baltica]